MLGLGSPKTRLDLMLELGVNAKPKCCKGQFNLIQVKTDNVITLRAKQI